MQPKKWEGETKLQAIIEGVKKSKFKSNRFYDRIKKIKIEVIKKTINLF